MTVDTFESKSMNLENNNVTEKMSEFHKSFKPTISPEYRESRYYTPDYQAFLHNWVGTDESILDKINADSVVSNVKQMYSGVTTSEGVQTLGINEVSTWNGDLKNKSILKSRAGYNAEIISTAKENIINDSLGNGIKTYRADDRPDLYPKNDQYVDKIRVDSNGKIIDRIQTKFIGDDGKSCYRKLISDKKFDKYFTDGKVDKIEIPKDYYKQAKEALAEDRISIKNQIEHLKSEGKYEIAEQKQARLDKINQLDGMLEQSNTSSSEAIQATKHPKLYSAKQFAKAGINEGLNQAQSAMIVTGAISTVENISAYIDGDISIEEAVKNIAEDTGTAGAAGFSVGFVSSSAAALMRSSSNELIRNVGSAGNGCLPAAAVSYGIAVHETVIDYAKGYIDNAELVEDLGRNGASVLGGFVGGAAGGIAGPAGSFAGASIGSKVTTTVYDTTKYVADTAVDLALGETTLEEVSEEIKDAAVDKAEEIKNKAETTISQYKEVAEYVAEETSEKIDEAKEVVNKTVEKTVEKVKDYQQSAKELVSSTVNYAVTSEAYATVVESCEGAIESTAEELSKLESKAKEYADKAVEKAADFGAEAVKGVKEAFSKFNIKNSLPFKL